MNTKYIHLTLKDYATDGTYNLSCGGVSVEFWIEGIGWRLLSGFKEGLYMPGDPSYVMISRIYELGLESPTPMEASVTRV